MLLLVTSKHLACHLNHLFPIPRYSRCGLLTLSCSHCPSRDRMRPLLLMCRALGILADAGEATSRQFCSSAYTEEQISKCLLLNHKGQNSALNPNLAELGSIFLPFAQFSSVLFILTVVLLLRKPPYSCHTVFQSVPHTCILLTAVNCSARTYCSPSSSLALEGLLFHQSPNQTMSSYSMDSACYSLVCLFLPCSTRLWVEDISERLLIGPEFKLELLALGLR